MRTNKQGEKRLANIGIENKPANIESESQQALGYKKQLGNLTKSSETKQTL